MNDRNEMPTEEEKQVLARARLLWACFLMGVVSFAGVVVFLLESGNFEAGDAPAKAYEMVAWAGAILSIPMALGMRVMIIRSGEELAEAWLRGNIVAFAVLEGAMLLCVTFALVSGTLMPFALIATIPAFFYLLLFPARLPEKV